MEYFFTTVQIVAGILCPIFVLILLWTALQAVIAWREEINYRNKKLEMYDVFDDEAEFYKVPNPKMVGVRLKKDDKIIWDGAIYRDQGLS